MAVSASESAKDKTSAFAGKYTYNTPSPSEHKLSRVWAFGWAIAVAVLRLRSRSCARECVCERETRPQLALYRAQPSSRPTDVFPKLCKAQIAAQSGRKTDFRRAKADGFSRCGAETARGISPQRLAVCDGDAVNTGERELSDLFPRWETRPPRAQVAKRPTHTLALLWVENSPIGRGPMG